MGGRTSRRTNTYSAPAIKRNELAHYKNTENGTNLSNYKDKLSRYNLSDREMMQIKIGLKCDYKYTKFNKFDFNICGNGRFTMYCYTFKIKKKSDGKREVEIETNRLEYNVTATQEYESRGWGILYWSKPRKYYKSRELTNSEINDIKDEMRQKMEKKLLISS
jgi:hypothetical protein